MPSPPRRTRASSSPRWASAPTLRACWLHPGEPPSRHARSACSASWPATSRREPGIQREDRYSVGPRGFRQLAFSHSVQRLRNRAGPAFPAVSIERDFGWTTNHPVVDAYRAYMKMPYDRPTWDLTFGALCGAPRPGLLLALRSGPRYRGRPGPDRCSRPGPRASIDT